MIQYLQSWFPGWGGWYGGSERGPGDLLPGTAQWEILGEFSNFAYWKKRFIIMI